MYMPNKCSNYSGSEVAATRIDAIVWDDEKHAMSIDQLNIMFTRTEYRLLFPLRTGSPVTYAQLAHLAYRYSVDKKVRTMIDKHIDRIRGKLKGSGIYIYCILGYGYMLLPDVVEDDMSSEMSTASSASTAKIATFPGKKYKQASSEIHL